MKDYLLIRLEAPLTSFGGVVVDSHGVEMAFPAPSMITGLLGNALGYRRQDFDALQTLQGRLRMAVRCDRRGTALRDFQTAKLEANDAAWTTRGKVEGRDGGAGTYQSPHIRLRDYHADRSVLVAMRLEPDSEPPTLMQIQHALREPKRPLFIGRKNCLPSCYLDAGIVTAPSAADALASAPTHGDGHATIYEPIAPDTPLGIDDLRVSGLRNWRNQVHGGEQRWRARTIDGGQTQ